LNQVSIKILSTSDLSCGQVNFLRTNSFKTSHIETRTVEGGCQAPLIFDVIGSGRDGWILGQEIYPLLLEPIFCGKKLLCATIFLRMDPSISSSRIKSLKLNKRLMFGTRFFVELKTINAVIQLFYLSRGLDIGQIIYLSLIWSFVTFLCDVPSSFLADKFGRKKLIMIGIFLTAISTSLLFFAHGFIFFTLTYIIGAAGYSFFMGADHAILYDSLKEVGEEPGANRVAGKYFSSASLPKIIMPFIGSFIARNLLPWQFMVIVTIIGTIASLVISSFLTEPKVEETQVKKFSLFKEGLKLIKSDRTLLKIALNKITIFQAAFVYWRVYQVLLKDAGMPTIYLGVIYTVFQGISFLMFWNTEKVQKWVGKMNFLAYPPVLGFVAIILSLVTSNLFVLFSCCVVLLVVGTIRDPLFLSIMQARIPSFNRATATSTLNMIKNISDVLILLTVGYLAKININYVLVTAGVLFLIPVIFMRITKGEVASS
jgi:MFS family permease